MIVEDPESKAQRGCSSTESNRANAPHFEDKNLHHSRRAAASLVRTSVVYAVWHIRAGSVALSGFATANLRASWYGRHIQSVCTEFPAWQCTSAPSGHIFWPDAQRP